MKVTMIGGPFAALGDFLLCLASCPMSLCFSTEVYGSLSKPESAAIEAFLREGEHSLGDWYLQRALRACAGRPGTVWPSGFDS